MRFYGTSVQNTCTFNEIRRTGEAYDFFIAFSTLQKEPFSLSFTLEARGKGLSSKKKTPDRRLDKTRNFSVYTVFLLKTITRVRFVKVVTFSIMLRLVAN